MVYFLAESGDDRAAAPRYDVPQGVGVEHRYEAKLTNPFADRGQNPTCILLSARWRGMVEIYRFLSSALLSTTIFMYYSLQEHIRVIVELWPLRAWRPKTPKRSSRTAPTLPAGIRSHLKKIRATCASACLSTAMPYSNCFKARPSHHHLLRASLTPQRLMLSLGTNSYWRTKISGAFYFLPNLTLPGTPSRRFRGSSQTVDLDMESWRGRP